ncbi:acyl-CoA dehydrogenase family protein [Nocardioides pyridinolyticus]
MELEPTARENAFRVKVREWLQTNAPTETFEAMETPRGLSQHLDWERTLHGAGYSAPHWPTAYGGGGLSPLMQAIFQEEYIRSGAPKRLNRMGLGLIGPTLIALGTDEQKSRWLGRILTCEDIWCQGFSERESGSDLASVRTIGRVEADGLVINGHKLWTSLAVFANWMFALVRTDEHSRRHDGLSFVLVPLDAEGVTVKPMRQLHGELGFAEVFFDDVFVPRDHVIGAVGEGWAVALKALTFERSNGLADHIRFSRSVRSLIELSHYEQAFEEPALRERLVQSYVETEVFGWYMQHTVTRDQDAPAHRAEANMIKLFWTEMDAAIQECVRDVLGSSADLLDEALGARQGAVRDYWHARAAMIFAGANEVQRNQIAERGLGLPRG